jgi:hypothetical protein
MGFLFHKRLRLAKGLWINLSKIRCPLSMGWRGLTTSVGRKGL